jgi:hypothetical protein
MDELVSGTCAMGDSLRLYTYLPIWIELVLQVHRALLNPLKQFYPL